MKKYFIIIYTCYTLVILSFCLVMAIFINKNINNQQKLLEKKQQELNYIIKLNNKIEENNYNLQELRIKNQQINNLNLEKQELLEKEKQLQNTINEYTKNNNNLKEKINYYE